MSDAVQEPEGGIDNTLAAAFAQVREQAVLALGDNLIVTDLQLPDGTGLDLIRATLKRLKAVGRVECLGRGQSAEWKRTGRW